MADDNTVDITPKQELLDLINSDNGTNFTLEDVDLSDPVISDISARNTKVTLTCKPNYAYNGTADLYYNRLMLSHLGSIELVGIGPLSTDELLKQIGEKKGVTLLRDDFEDIVIPPINSFGTVTITLQSKTNAVKWLGSMDIGYVNGLPNNLDGLHNLIHVTLPSPGFLT